MRSRRAADRYPTLLVLLLLSVVSTACNVRDDYRFAYGGIGTELHTGGIAERYHVGEMYFGYLCGKANLPVVDGASVGGLPVCSYGEFFEQDWNRMVQAGLNDIDARCDAYLAWQDERKRLGPARVAQLNTTSQFVQAIIGVYEPTSLAIRVVSHAFGFATASFENYNQRLLYQIDTSTLQSLVITRQQTFRTQLVKQGISFNGKPSVEHGLRSYLRICMPMTIETEINNVLTVFDRTGEGPPQNLVTVGTSQAAVRSSRGPLVATDPGPRTIRSRTGIEGGVSETEKRGDDPQARAVQRALCLPADGKFGPATRTGIRIFELEMMRGKPDTTVNSELNAEELGELLSRGDCPPGFKNYLERTQFDKAGNVDRLRTLLQQKFPTVTIGPTLVEMRPQIAVWRRELVLDNGPDNVLSDQITREFLANINFFD
ncbi:MAG: hypothetical protein M3Y78_11725 [Pseudomonadota bacterium]|nr:hypothetical protein [Pseudomonadota bacterium]